MGVYARPDLASRLEGGVFWRGFSASRLEGYIWGVPLCASRLSPFANRVTHDGKPGSGIGVFGCFWMVGIDGILWNGVFECCVNLGWGTRHGMCGIRPECVWAEGSQIGGKTGFGEGGSKMRVFECFWGGGENECFWVESME